MKLEQLIDESGNITSDRAKAKFLRITSYSDETGSAIRSWNIKLNTKEQIEKALIHLDLSHHDIQVLGYLKHGDLTLESDKMQSSGMTDSLKNLERLDLVESRDTNYATIYKLTNKGTKILREL